jgi:hypothetical protein
MEDGIEQGEQKEEAAIVVIDKFNFIEINPDFYITTQNDDSSITLSNKRIYSEVSTIEITKPVEIIPDAHPLLQSISSRRRSQKVRHSTIRELGIEIPREIQKIQKITLTLKPRMEISREESVNSQIKEFFQTPCPVNFYGYKDKGTNLMGSFLEYNLRKLVGAEILGEYENLISWKDSPNEPIEIVAVVFHDKLDSDLLPDIVFPGKFAIWGKYSFEVAKNWDSSVNALFKV